MLRGESDSSDLRLVAEPRTSNLTAADLKEVKFDSLEQIAVLVDRYRNLDVPKEESMLFFSQLTGRRDAWFVEAGDRGLIYLTSIKLGWDANFHVVFWDRSLKIDRVAAAKTVLTEAFRRFELPRITSTLAYQNLPMKRFLKDLGFVLEGVTRLGWSVDPPIDRIQYGILEAEKPWPILPMEVS